MSALDTITVGSVTLDIRPLATDGDASACATIMSTTEPWLTLGRTQEQCLALMRHPDNEVSVATERTSAGDETIVGFVIVVMRGAFVGYIRSVAVRVDWRGRSLGSALIAFAERRILRETPNVFMCVSSFNPRARALYLRLGYEIVGELRDYIVRGHSELLLRKSTGPISEFQLAANR